MLLIDELEQHLHPYAQQETRSLVRPPSARTPDCGGCNARPDLPVARSEDSNDLPGAPASWRHPVRRLPDVHGPDVAGRARELGFEFGLARDALTQLTRAIVLFEGDWDRRLLHHCYQAEVIRRRILVTVLQGSNELGAFADASVIPALGYQ
jgi:hypothetical protein